MVSKIKDSHLRVNLNELVHTLVRELATSLRKIGIYGPGHPSSVKALEKPFLAFDRLFKFKKYINFNLQQGYLFVLNIRLKESVFNQEILKYMQSLDINAMLFEREISVPEFGKFCDRLVRRIAPNDNAINMSSFLKENRIESIEVNSERAYWGFENMTHLRGDIDFDTTIGNVLSVLLPNSIEKLAKLYRLDENYAIRKGFDYEYDLVKLAIPEKIALLPAEKIKEQVSQHLSQLIDADEEKRSELLENGKTIYQLINYHPDKENIIEKVDALNKEHEDYLRQLKEFRSPTGKIKMEASTYIDNLLDNIFSEGSPGLDHEEFIEAFNKLLKTGQQKKAKEIIADFVERMTSTSFNDRQKSLSLLLTLIQTINPVTENQLFCQVIDKICDDIAAKKETYEYSELILAIIDRAFQQRKFDKIARMVQVMNQRRTRKDTVMVYDSIVIKKVFDRLNEDDFINRLIKEFLTVNTVTIPDLKTIFVEIGSEQAAMALSNIISHPNRQVRQYSMKFLADMGKAALAVCARILTDKDMFARQDGRYELPDENWYIVRNAIFVLGLLEDKEGAVLLRRNINDPDIRVRREILASLERIGGEEACDIFMMMANDIDREIRETAVLKIGIIGDQEHAPLLIDLASTNPNITLHAIHSLGQIGGKKAIEFLGRSLMDTAEIAQMAGDRISKDDIRVAIIKALGKIGGRTAIQKIVDYKENLPKAQKLFFKNSSINKAIEEILSR